MDRLSDAEWARIEHLFPTPGATRSGRPAANPRAVLDAILWIERTGERWIYLPAHFPPQQTCYAKYLNWKRGGRLDQMRALLTQTGAHAAAARHEADLVETV